MKYAIVSVSDKSNLDVLVKGLKGYTLISTGGTYKAIEKVIKDEKLDIALRKVSEVTSFPEMLDGRVKSLHPMIHGSILYRRDDERHLQQAKEHKLLDINLVVVNLYPFEEAVKKEVEFEEMIEEIDIGGPTMLISAVKNHKHVTVLVDPDDYEELVRELDSGISAEYRQKCAIKAMNRLADYRSVIAVELSSRLGGCSFRFSSNGRKLGRYGENWHQTGWFYGEDHEQLHGPDMGYNNYLDADASFKSILDLKEVPAVSIVKHSNPCGYATGRTLAEALEKAWDGDDVSAFGSIITFSQIVDLETARFLDKKFVEVLIAPDYEEDALEHLKIKKNLRILRKEMKAMDSFDIRGVDGGLLRQTCDDVLYLGPANGLVKEAREQDDDGKARLVGSVTGAFSKEQIGLIEFSIKAVKHLKSNAISICHEYAPGSYMQLGMGCGQPNRLNSVRLAIEKAQYNLKKSCTQEEMKKILSECVLSSDAFFPFRDSIDDIAKLGIKNIVQPGGSIRDDEVIAAAKEHGLNMVFTGVRHFRH